MKKSQEWLFGEDNLMLFESKLQLLHDLYKKDEVYFEIFESISIYL
jgi:hypothetical protein